MSFSGQYLLEKLFRIDQELGGTAKVEEKAKMNDEFAILKDMLLQNMYLIKKKNAEKQDQERNTEVIKSEYEIRQKITENDNLLNKMNEVLRKQQKDKTKYPPKDIERKNKLYENFRTQVQQIRQLVYGQNIELDNSMQTLNDQRNNLFSGRQGELDTERGNRSAPREMTEEEKSKIEEWKQIDAKHDELLAQINTGMDEWLKKAKQMSQAIDATVDKIKQLDTEVDGTTKTLVTTNKQLKEIMTAFRGPSKFCLDIVLLLTIVGLVATGYYYFKG